MSNAGKEVLLKAVIQSIPTYVMSCFELPKQLCWDIHQCMARFWWGTKSNEKKIHWMAWEKLCSPKAEGGLGFRNLNTFNQALLAKQGWRLLKYPNSVVARVLKAKYFPNTSFMEASSPSGMSYSWRSIITGREVLAKGLRYQIGDGRCVSIWNDPWIPLPHSFKPFSLPLEGTEMWNVEDIIDPESRTWNATMVENLFTKMEADLILSIPLSHRPSEDKLVWHHDRKGSFNVKSCYHLARTIQRHHTQATSSANARDGRSNLWNKIWKARIPPKIRAFAWRLLKGILPTRDALARKITLPDLSCIFCHNHIESDVHLFMRCSALVNFWYACSFGELARNQSQRSISEWIFEVATNHTSQQLDKFLTCLWVIWKERNNILWNGGDFNTFFMATWTTNHL